MSLNPFNDSFYMTEALKEANKALVKNEVPVGCIIVCEHQIIARAHNLTELLKDVTAHAEMQAITAAASFLGGKYLTECVLYVTLEPCVMCAGAIYWSQVKKIVFGAKDNSKGNFLFNKNMLYKNTQVVGGVMQEECEELMSKFFKNKR